MIRRRSPAEIATPVGRYSHPASAPAGHEILFPAGQPGILPDGTLAGPGTAPEFVVEVEACAAVPRP